MASKQVFGSSGDIPLSPAVSSGNILYVSGQVPTRPDGTTPNGIEAQTEVVLEKIAACVREAGGTMEDVVKTTVFLKRVDDFAAMNAVYAGYFGGVPPARSTIRCDLMIDILVEIEAVAHL